MTGEIFSMERFSIHDGPGVRTSIFFKGCPLHCIWCHNPESHERGPVLQYLEKECVGCAGCVSACPSGVHSFIMVSTGWIVGNVPAADSAVLPARGMPCVSGEKPAPQKKCCR